MEHKLRDIRNLQAIDLPSETEGYLSSFREEMVRAVGTARQSDYAQEKLVELLIFCYQHIMNSPEK